MWAGYHICFFLNMWIKDLIEYLLLQAGFKIKKWFIFPVEIMFLSHLTPLHKIAIRKIQDQIKGQCSKS